MILLRILTRKANNLMMYFSFSYFVRIYPGARSNPCIGQRMVPSNLSACFPPYECAFDLFGTEDLKMKRGV